MAKKPTQPAKAITEMSGPELRAYFEQLLSDLKVTLVGGSLPSKGLLVPKSKAKGRKGADPAPDALVLDNPILPPQTRGRGSEVFTTWWGKAWLDAVDDPDDESRLARGRTYARNGSVVRIEVSKGNISARVQGSEPTPYLVKMTLNQFSDEGWASVLQAITTQASFAAKLLAGELPIELVKIFETEGATLFPILYDDVNFSCTCEDWSTLCKHAAAVYYIVGNQIEKDPLTLLHLRGRTRDEILGYLRERRIAEDQEEAQQAPSEQQTTEALAASDFELSLDHFWQVGRPQFIQVELSKDSVPAIFRIYGEPPSAVRVEMHAIYDQVRSKAFRFLMATRQPSQQSAESDSSAEDATTLES